ncbi:hypothetical protein EMPS_08580 [Entomortierella parvispora]|uniref:Uncharacterized protein n=1 Tax=Entomortierella parvispora TaxID=205924 RepID=A0A9P3HGN3_9FUNG|nr:hypothetical protein EMPS_08580 [Entomortierella parvispora]
MVHPGIVVAGVFGVVVTGVVIYTILKEEIDEFLDSFEKPSLVGASGGGRHRQQQQQDQQQQQRRFSHDENFQAGGQSSSMYQPDYELRQRRRPDEEDEKEPDHDILMERLRRINESEANIEASEARLAALERAMKEREEQLERNLQELKARKQQSSELYRNPFEANEPLIRDYNVNDSQDLLISDESGAKVDTRAAHAILRHDLSSNHQENINPFEDPSTLISNASASAHSSVRGDEDDFVDAEDRRSATAGSHRDDEEDLDWTDAEVGSVGSHDSDESWGSP